MEEVSVKSKSTKKTTSKAKKIEQEVQKLPKSNEITVLKKHIEEPKAYKRQVDESISFDDFVFSYQSKAIN